MSHTVSEEFIGPCFIIICFVLVLYGVFCAQIYFYWTTYEDHCIVRWLVGVLVVLETAHVAFCIHALYDYLILDYNNSEALAKIVWSVGVSIHIIRGTPFTLLSIRTIVTHTAFSVPYQWSGSRLVYLSDLASIVTGFLSVLWIARMGVAFRYDSYLFQYSEWDAIDADKSYWIVLNTAFALNVIMDLATTFVLTLHLYLSRSWAIKRSTRNIVGTLINLVIGAGALNLIASIALFITSNLSKESITYGGIMELEAKLYANSMLAMLNARRGIVDRAATNGNYTLDLSRIQSHFSNGHLPIIRVQKEIAVTVDPWYEDAPGEKPGTPSSNSTPVSETV
ncbi:hypothetical protein BC629DRAFT_1587079 [Irpex lacteus]|nr:hypothetical protein BC629DRAFT_1587079 [Irpex lacteus]